MPNLTIDTTATITTITGVRLNVIALAGQQGIPGPAGRDGTGVAAAGVSSLNALSGSLNIIGAQGISIGTSGFNILVSGSTVTSISGYITTGQADLRYYPLNSNPNGYSNGGPASVSTHQLYVNKGGSDLSGNGTIVNPYLTIQKALTKIISPSITGGYDVIVGPGLYSGDLFVPSFTNLIGGGTSLNQYRTGLIFTGVDDYCINSINGFSFESNFFRIESPGAAFSKLVIKDCYSYTGIVVLAGSIANQTEIFGGDIGTYPLQGNILYNNGRGLIDGGGNPTIAGYPNDNLYVDIVGWSSTLPMSFRDITIPWTDATVVGSNFPAVIFYGSNAAIHTYPNNIRNEDIQFVNGTGYIEYYDTALNYPYYPSNTGDWQSNTLTVGSGLDQLPIYIRAVSGGLQSQINGKFIAVTSLNGTNGNLTLTSAGNNLSIATIGNVIYVSGIDIASGSNLASTGSYLYNLITGASGNSSNVSLSGYITTGRADLRYYPLSTNPSGYITTGQTGQFYLSSNPQQYTTSGNLSISGAVLWNQTVLESGILATGIAQTGSALDTKINSLSGYIGLVSGGLQSQIVGAVGTQVKITGSSILSSASFTGIGGLLIYTSGSTVIISGGSAVGGGITQAQLDSLSGWAASSTNLGLTGSNLYNLITAASGQANTNYATISNVTNTGVQLGTSIASLSGYLNNVSGGLQVEINGLASITNLTATGATLASRDLIISGLFTTGDTNTGAALYNLITSLSGQGNINYATVSNLASTGAQLGTSITSLSGYLGSVSGGLQAQIAGFATVSTVNIISGNLASTGQQLYSLVTGLSGQSVLNYATISNLASTGSQAWLAANNNSINLSGNLTQTGIQLQNRDLLISGIMTTGLAVTGSSLYNLTTGLSGYMVSLIGASAAGVSSINGASGVLTIGGASNVSVTTVGQNITVSGNTGDYALFAQKTALTTTGQSLYNLITGLSGQSILSYATITNLTSTGVQLGTSINSLSGYVANISGGLQAELATFATISTTNIISGNLVTTGQQLYNLITGLSGQSVSSYATISNLASTGQQVLVIANNNSINLSGNLTQTGVQLQTIIISSGQQSWNAANNNGINLSGNLTQTGVQLLNSINIVSGRLASFVSGFSQFDSRIVSIPTGISSLYIPFTLPFSGNPSVLGNLIYTGDSFVASNILSISNTGFSIVFSDVIKYTGYNYDYLAISGSLINLYNGVPLDTPTTLNYATGLLITGTASKIYRCILTGVTTIQFAPPANDGTRIKLWLLASGSGYNVNLQSGIKIPSFSSYASPITIASGSKAKYLFEYDAVQNGGQWELTSFINGF